ncbi:MAG: hypothetical protein RR960_05315, partial [Alistipes sp.]
EDRVLYTLRPLDRLEDREMFPLRPLDKLEDREPCLCDLSTGSRIGCVFLLTRNPASSTFHLPFPTGNSS